MNQSKIRISRDLLEICEELLQIMNTAKLEEALLYDINTGILMELCSRVDLAEKNYDLNKEFIYASRKFLKNNMQYVFMSRSYGLKRKVNYFFVSMGLGRIWRIFYKLRKGLTNEE